MVMVSFEALFGSREAPSYLGKRWLAFFKLPVSEYERFWLHGIVACALHDIGKANQDFQQLVRHELKDGQLIRHEHLSGLLMFWPECEHWLNRIDGLDLWVVFSAVVSHHIKITVEKFAQPQNQRAAITLYPKGVQSVFRLLAKNYLKHLELAAPAFELPVKWSFKDKVPGQNALDLADDIKMRLRKYQAGLRRDPQKAAFLNAVRAGLILADSAGSGLSRTMREEARPIEEMANWLQDVFSGEQVQTGQDIDEKVIEPRLRQLRQRGVEFEWRDYQTAAEELPQRALYLASCGSGKTLAAWRWIRARLNDQPRSRVIFLYPTRATATEGFRDYVGWAPEADAALMHGTSIYELESLFENAGDTSSEDERAEKEFLTDARLFAIGYWPRRIFSATVDQFLGFMQFIYRSVCVMPLLADSVLVIDEVHSFDPEMFSALKHFLRHFDVPVLCMTASLPESRQEELVACGMTLFPSNEGEGFANLNALAGMPRYQVHRLDDAMAALDVALAGKAAGKKVLWVVNTVDRCQTLARELGALCYHSRFKLVDRKQAHKRVVEAFQGSNDPVIAITTQVCEMSLDLDADILITEVAPITSLIQRMGRCNRHAEIGSGKLGQVYVYQPEKMLPYGKDDLEGVAGFLARLNGQTVAQTDLEQGLKDFGSQEGNPERYAAFLHSGVWASPTDFRDALDHSTQAILDIDIPDYEAKVKHREPIDGLVLPAPKKMASPDPRLARSFYQSVPAIHYSSEWGLQNPSAEVLS